MSTTPSPEIWNNILKNSVEKDDPFWKEYLDKAAAFDVRMVDERNKIVDVLLVYVALFISVLASFIGRTTQSQRNPAEITNDLLVAIYYQLVAQSNNNSIPLVDPRSYFNQSAADYDSSLTQNMVLYISLSLSIGVSIIALAAKLWLVSYGRQAFSVGSPYDRAMKRQEAYNGVLVWNMGGVINMLPVILLVAVYLFGFYVYVSAWAVQDNIGHTTGALLGGGVMFLISTSFGAAFVSGCPFRSVFSGFIRSIFGSLQTLSKRIACGCLSSRRLRWLWIGTFTVLWAASDAVVAYAIEISGAFFAISFLVAGIPIAYSTQQEAVHKPQKYKLSLLAVFLFISVSLSKVLATVFEIPIFISLYIIGMLGVISTSWMISKMSKSMADTGEIDAIAWLMITTPPQYPATFFKKAGQMTGVDSIGLHYRPRLLESLLPLLSPLITSYHAPEVPEHHSSDTHSPQSGDVLKGRLQTHLSLVDDNMVPIDEKSHLKNLEIYVACLARLSEFTDSEGTFWCWREDAMRHPILEQPLIAKLVELANTQSPSQVVRSAATQVLHNYKLDMEGNPLRSPTAVMGSVATVPRNAATSMSNNDGLNSQEQGHSELNRPDDPATHVEPACAATSMLNDSKLNSQGQGLPTRVPRLYRPDDPATHVEPACAATSMLNDSGLNSQLEEQGLPKLCRPDDPATHVEPASAATSMLNDSALNSQEQGLPKLYRPVDPATCVEPEECGIGDKEIEEVMSEGGD